MATDIKEAIRRLFYQYKVEGADEVMATQEAVAASTTKTDKASLSLEKSFGSLERRYVETVRAQQDYQKVQEKVNAAVAQNPELQERANVVLAQARQHFDNVATGAGKADIAATLFLRTVSRTIGPLALVGAAVAAVSSAMEFMEPIAVRVGADIYRRFSEAYPAAARFAEGIYNAGKQFYDLERGQAKLEAINAALKGTASAAQLAALKIEKMNQEMARKIGLGEAALAAQRIADHVMRLREIYPGVTIETAKQLELMDAQLRVAQARTTEEERIAQQYLDQAQYLQQGLSLEEAILLAARKRTIAETKAETEARKDNVYYSQNQTAATNETYKAQSRIVQAVDDTSRALSQTSDALTDVGNKAYKVTIFFDHWGESLARALERTYALSAGMRQQFSLGGMGQNMQAAFLANLGSMMGQTYTGGVAAGPADINKMIADALNSTTSSLDQLTDSTDSLNATMQNALSPFYSQDPRTTHLGFRAGVVGNENWLAPGASSQAGALAAILGPGATAPGMADGGSFVVGGGYSANDNKIAAFPVASGEQVTVNRNRAGAKGGQVIHIDNRTIINGRVDADVFAQMKVSKYQQAQRMRAGLAVA